MVRVSSPGKTQTMVRVNCQNGDGGGCWVGDFCFFEFFGVSGSVGAIPGHKSDCLRQGQLESMM